MNPDGFDPAINRDVEGCTDYVEEERRRLNLTWEVRDGILNHRTSGNPSTLEGQVVRLSDKIAYIHHDMDDAQRAGIISEDDYSGHASDAARLYNQRAAQYICS